METSVMKMMRLAAIAAALLLSFEAIAQAQTTLRIGLAEDPDALDPSTARTYVGRIVFSAFCDKLFDIDEKLNIVPQLALGPGHVVGTALPGQVGNFAVAGHRVTAGNPFWGLPGLRPGSAGPEPWSPRPCCHRPSFPVGPVRGR